MAKNFFENKIDYSKKWPSLVTKTSNLVKDLPSVEDLAGIELIAVISDPRRFGNSTNKLMILSKDKMTEHTVPLIILYSHVLDIVDQTDLNEKLIQPELFHLINDHMMEVFVPLQHDDLVHSTEGSLLMKLTTYNSRSGTLAKNWLDCQFYSLEDFGPCLPPAAETCSNGKDSQTQTASQVTIK